MPMTADDCRACSAIWLQRGKAENISIRRATILMALHRSWETLANQKDRYEAILKDEGE
jgi:Zn-finger nucleic acid-binding protein